MQPSQHKPIYAVHLSQLFPVNKLEGKRQIFMRHDTGSAYIYTCGNQVIIRSAYEFDSIYYKPGEPGFKELRYTTLVFSKGSEYGSFTDEHKHLYDITVKVDSLRSATDWTARLQQMIYNVFLDKGLTKIWSGNISGTDTLKEMYNYVDPKDTTGKVALELYYVPPIPNIAFSLSPQLDSIKQRTLCKVAFTIKARHYKEQDVFADASTAMYDIKPIPVKDTAVIMAIFRQDKWSKQ